MKYHLKLHIDNTLSGACRCCMCLAVSCGEMIKQEVAARSSIGLQCQDYVKHNHPGESGFSLSGKKGKGRPYSTAERRVPELIPDLGSQPAGDVTHKPGGRLPLLSARPAVTLATLKRTATNFAAW